MSEAGDFTDKHPPKPCAWCGKPFPKPSTYSRKQWEAKTCCSYRCSGLNSRGRSDGFLSNGYVYLRVNNESRLRSHLVIEHMIGRPLRRGEVVDHINGNRVDDRPDNLRLFASNAEHVRTHWAEGTVVPLGVGNGKGNKRNFPAKDWPK